MSDAAALEIIDAVDSSRLEGYLDGTLGGFIEYELIPEGWDLIHTVVLDAFQGQGIAPRLAAAIFERAAESGRKIRPTCPFVKKYYGKHPELADLIVASA
jgi:predicted GNAT family acetyltransferase